MKSVMFTHRYFWPDTAPYGLILSELTDKLDSEFDVRVFSTIPSYTKNTTATPLPEGKTDSVTRIKTLNEHTLGLPGRALNAVWYAVRLFIHIIRHRPSLVTASTFPPVLAALAAALACKISRSRFAYVLMDVYPDVVFIGKPHNHAYAVLAAIDNFSLRLADHIVVLSEDMKHTLVRRGIETVNIQTIPNIELRQAEEPLNLQPLPTFDNSRLTIAFCGNIGHFQGLDTFRSVVRTLCQRGVARIVFMGEGKYKPALLKYFKDNDIEHVHFINRMPVHTARTLMASADLNLVSLSPGVSDCSFPSKASTICSVSGPMLIYDNPQSELSQLVAKHGAGIIGDHTQHAKIVDEITELYKNRERLKQLRNGSANLYKAHFEHAKVVSAWRQLISEDTDKAGDIAKRYLQ